MWEFPSTDQIAWTFLHSIWEGLAIAALLALAFRFLRERSANARYVAACIALVLMVVCPLCTFLALPRYIDDPGPLTNVLPRDAQPLRQLQHARMILQPICPWLLRMWVMGTAVVG